MVHKLSDETTAISFHLLLWFFPLICSFYAGERKLLTMVNLRQNLICFKVNSGQGSLPAEGVSSGAPINMPTIPRFQQAHLGKKQSGKGTSQKTLCVRIRQRGEHSDLYSRVKDACSNCLTKPRGMSEIPLD